MDRQGRRTELLENLQAECARNGGRRRVGYHHQTRNTAFDPIPPDSLRTNTRDRRKNCDPFRTHRRAVARVFNIATADYLSPVGEL